MNQEYKNWLDKPDLADDLKAELKAMDDQAIDEAFYKPLSFGTGGMRGILGAGINRMNIYTLRKAALGFAQYLLENYDDAKERGVAIAYDNRHKSEDFAKASAEVLAANGINSFLFENIRPTPLLSYAVRETHACGGIVVTASHNPPNYNGFKIYDHTGCQLVPKYADQVVENVNNIEDLFSVETMPFEEAVDKGLVKMLGRKMDNAYIEAVSSVQFEKGKKKNLKVVFTPLHGTSREVGLRSLTEAGFTVIPVEEQMIADPDFSTVKSPNPEDPKAFERAIKVAKDNQADLIIATDPDGDRLGIAVRHNKEYAFLTGNQTGALFIDYILGSLKALNTLPEHGVIFNTIVTSDFGARIANSYGINTISTLTGFKFIGEKMHELENEKETFLFGYEESYGYVIKDFVRDKDAIQAMVLAAELADVKKRNNQTLVDYLHELYALHGTHREELVNLVLEGKAGEAKIEKIMDTFRDYLPEKFVDRKVLVKEDYLTSLRYEEGHEHIINYPTSNVIKFILEDDAWFVLRPSGTEPKLKIYIALKAPSIAEADKAIATIKDAIMEIIDSV